MTAGLGAASAGRLSFWLLSPYEGRWFSKPSRSSERAERTTSLLLTKTTPASCRVFFQNLVQRTALVVADAL
jgi:hypothetical protein